MSHTVRLQVAQLEEREVPAAALFADVMPGIWGSYPMNLTPSGGTLFFTADNGHGYELYSTDGTPGSAHMVKDIKPGLGGSNPGQFFAADDGVVYFTADDGTGRALWRSDGAAAGTKKVPGMPADARLDQPLAIGRNGELHFTTSDPTGAGQTVGWWKTDGTTTTLLRTFAYSPDITNVFQGIGGDVVLVRRYSPFDQPESMWKTDGTPGGTYLWQRGLIGSAPETGSVYLTPGVEISPGRFVHATMDFTGAKASLWVGNGQTNAWTDLLKVFDTATAHAVITTPLVELGGKVYFAVRSDDPAVAGLWVSDGTAAGTRKADLPFEGGLYEHGALTPFSDQLLIQTGTYATGYRYYVTNGTAAGTTELPRPAGASGLVYFAGLIPPGEGEPRGAVLMRSGSINGPLFRTDGTAAGTVWVDPAGLPSGYQPRTSDGYQTDGFGRVVQPYDRGGVYFNGALYFPAANGDQRSELWKWDAPAPPGSGVVAPRVLGVAVNDGSAQRSVVTGLTISFDRAVNIGPGALTLTDATGKVFVVYIEDPVSGTDTLTVHFGGGPLPDGRYTLTLNAGAVSDAETGGLLAADYSFGFTRLFGDLNGDGVYDRDARWMVRDALGLRAGDAGYLLALDSNADGVIDSIDELAAVRNWGKSV